MPPATLPRPASPHGRGTAGAVGIAAGFIGRILFLPEANQGPLLGIFVMGPLGFLAGAVGGALY